MNPLSRNGSVSRSDVEPAAREGVKAGAEGNHVTVAGGGAASVASVSDPVTISSSEPGFGFPGWDVWFLKRGWEHRYAGGFAPYAATFVNGFNELAKEEHGSFSAGGEARDLEAVLPAGFLVTRARRHAAPATSSTRSCARPRPRSASTRSEKPGDTQSAMVTITFPRV